MYYKTFKVKFDTFEIQAFKKTKKIYLYKY